MRALLQRVRSAEVTTGGKTTGKIASGLLVYVAVAEGDSPSEARRLAEKVANLRIFTDDADKLNRCVLDEGGQVLVIPNFTLLADARKGRRPAFAAAASGGAAEPLHQAFLHCLRQQGCRVETGTFGTHMEIDSLADGPVNVIVDFPPATSS